jgi:hypothetical protein
LAAASPPPGYFRDGTLRPRGRAAPASAGPRRCRNDSLVIVDVVLEEEPLEHRALGFHQSRRAGGLYVRRGVERRGEERRGERNEIVPGVARRS